MINYIIFAILIFTVVGLGIYFTRLLRRRKYHPNQPEMDDPTSASPAIED